MNPTEQPTVESPAQRIQNLEREYLLQNYARYPVVLRRGKGCWLHDVNGKKYLDLISGIGVNALGHAHPRIVRAIREQANLLVHCSNLYYHEYQGPLAKKIVETSGLARCFFSNSGTESMEGALKMVKAHGNRTAPGKCEIIALENSFHGRTIGALSITGQPKYRKDFEPLMPGVKFIAINDVAALEAAVNERTAGIILEGIQGEGGIYPLTPEFAHRARALADQHNALLVFDEIQCGVGRPGVHYSYQLASPVILPDVMVAAKPLGCGLPLGVIACNEKAASSIAPGMHGTTFGGGALACRVALEFFDVLDELMPSIRTVGGYFKSRLEDLGREFGFVKQVRGAGLMLGMEIAMPGRQIVLDAMADGLLINCTHDTVLRFLPPYIITEKEVERAVRSLRKIFAKTKPAE